MPFPPFPCTGFENVGNANIYVDGVKVNTIAASRCYTEWYCAYMSSDTGNAYTWDWRDGDPDAPPEDPPVEPDPL